MAFPAGSVVLDISAGSGRDMDILIREECKACGAEPNARLLEVTEAPLPHLAGRVCADSLTGLSHKIERKFDGVLCSGVFMHIPEEEQFDAAFDIRPTPEIQWPASVLGYRRPAGARGLAPPRAWKASHQIDGRVARAALRASRLPAQRQVGGRG